jgi:HD-like signal output (HDOD) protein
MTDTLERDIEAAMTAMVARGAVSVPPYPAVALKLGELVKRDSYGLDEVGRLVAADATLSADLLRCANSSAYARGTGVTSLQQAVARVGAQEVVRLAVASALAKTTQTAGPLQTMKRAAWQCSVASALLCQELASLRKLPVEDAFLCGLLHDYGRLLAISSLEEILAEMPDVGARPLASWVALVDRVHVQLGLLMATKWHLPKLFQDVIALHHGEAATWTGPHAPMVDIVATSDAIVQSMLTEASIDADALAAFPRLDPRERARLADAIPAIPSVIASFEGEVRGRPAASKVVVPETTLPEGFRRLEVPVQQLKPKKRGPYTLRGIAASGWVMTGKDTIADNSLIEVTIECAPSPITLWAHTTRCVPEGGGVRVECKAFALGGAVARQFFELFRGAAT